MNAVLTEKNSIDAYERTYLLPDLEPAVRERRERQGRALVSSGMDESVLGQIRLASGGAVTLNTIYRFIEYRMESGIQMSTIRTYVFYIKRSLRRGLGIQWQRDRELRDQIDDFFRSILPPNPRERRIVVPSREDIVRLISLSASRSSLIAETIYNSGMRISELCWLRVQEIHRVDPHFHEWSVSEKGGGTRTIIMHADLLNDIERVFRGRTHLFETGSGNPYDRINAANLIRYSSRELLGREFGPHLLRHAFATHMLEDYPHAITEIMRMGGWKRADTFLKTYVHARLEPGASPRLPKFVPTSVDEIPRYSRIKGSPEFKALKNQKRRDQYAKGAKT